MTHTSGLVPLPILLRALYNSMNGFIPKVGREGAESGTHPIWTSFRGSGHFVLLCKGKCYTI